MSNETIGQLKDWTAEKLLQEAQAVARGLSQEEAVRTQLYKILSSLKSLQRRLSLQSFDRNQVMLLQIDLAWAASKHNKLKNVCNEVMQRIPQVHDTEDFERLVRFVEAIVAFNAYGEQPQTGGRTGGRR